MKELPTWWVINPLGTRRDLGRKVRHQSQVPGQSGVEYGMDGEGQALMTPIQNTIERWKDETDGRNEGGVKKEWNRWRD